MKISQKPIYALFAQRPSIIGIDYLKMALQARKVSRTFEKVASGSQHSILSPTGNQMVAVLDPDSYKSSPLWDIL